MKLLDHRERATSKRETWRKDNETTISNLVPLHEERST